MYPTLPYTEQSVTCGHGQHLQGLIPDDGHASTSSPLADLKSLKARKIIALVGINSSSNSSMYLILDMKFYHCLDLACSEIPNRA